MSHFRFISELAFDHGPAHEANQLIDDIRTATRAKVGSAVSYEIVLTGRSWDYLWEVVAPRLALFLRAKQFRIDRCEPVFLSIFLGDELYFVRAGDFFQALRLSRGMTEESFAALVRGWGETGRSALVALPAGEGAVSSGGGNGRRR